MKIAICKSRLYKGGVFQVILGITQVLNQLNVDPDIITLKSNVDQSSTKVDYNNNVRFRIIEIFYNLKLPYEWHFIFYNLISKFYTNKYDIIIDSNNTSFLSSASALRINYIHYPRKDRSLQIFRSIHFPKGAKKKLLDLYSDPFLILKRLYKYDRSLEKSRVIIANSQFTKNAILNNYNINPELIEVIYPPIDIPKNLPSLENRKNTVISLGRFSPEKRQLEQIEIASLCPHLHFVLIGFSSNEEYLDNCKRLIIVKNINNVTLMPNAPWQNIKQHLVLSSYFIHNVRNEPFGITSVQAITHGLIPIVHNSGGQCEIVVDSQLRFSDHFDAAQKLHQLSSQDQENKNNIHKILYDHCSKFDRSNFNRKMTLILTKYITVT